MLQSERDHLSYLEAKRKFENRQRMLDKGWGDIEAYNRLIAYENKKKRKESIKQFLLGGLAAILFCILFFGTNYLMHGYAI
jgi:hypothetical protein